MQKKSMLFSGTPDPFGGLSNEHELVELCPPEFRRENQWSKYANRVFAHGAHIANWIWRADDRITRSHQRRCFYGILGTRKLPCTERDAVAGWLLSEMLLEVPEHIPFREGVI